MASALKNLSKYDESSLPSIEEKAFGIVVADWNEHITHALYEGCYDTLIKHGAKEKNIHTIQVPGAFELTTAAAMLAQRHQVDAVICLGCVIKGETTHNEYINHAVGMGLTNLGIATAKGGKYGNKGVEAAVTAIRMADLKENLGKKKQKIGFG